MSDDQPMRRVEDRESAIMLAVEKRLGDNRHLLRAEFGAAILRLEAAQVKAQAQATKEHAEVRADVADLKHHIEPIPKLAARVEEIEGAEAYEEGRLEGLAAFRRTIKWAVGILIAAIAACTGLLAVLMNHP